MESGRAHPRAENPERPADAERVDFDAAALDGGAAEDDGQEGGSRLVQRMCIRVGALGLLFPFDVGREVIGPPSVTRIPNSVSWLRGLANVRGALVPVVDTAAAFGMEREPGVASYLLILGHGETALGLLIDGLPRLLDLAASQLVSDSPPTPRLLAEAVTATYEHGGRTWFDVDLDVLFDILAGHVAPDLGARSPSDAGLRVV